MLDTNILLSAALFPNERVNGIIEFIVKNHSLVLSDLVIKEFIEVADYDKFKKVEEAKAFLKKLSFTAYKTPKVKAVNGLTIRDEEDYDILFAAVKSKVDIFITGDKDFHECEVDNPRIMTLNDFKAEYMPG
jgi:putative PIN family toxin of toxin-antitoxin system